MNAPKNEAEGALSLAELDHILPLFDQEAPLPPHLQRKREEFVDHFKMMLIRKRRNQLPYLREVRRRLPDPPRLIPLLRELLLRTFSGTYEASVCTTLVELGQRMVDPAPAVLALLAKFQQILTQHYYDKMTPDHYFDDLRALCKPPREAAEAEGEGEGPRRPAGWAPQPAWFAFLFAPQHTQVMEVEEDHPYLDPVWSWRLVLEALVEWFDWIQAPTRVLAKLRVAMEEGPQDIQRFAIEVTWRLAKKLVDPTPVVDLFLKEAEKAHLRALIFSGLHWLLVDFFRHHGSREQLNTVVLSGLQGVLSFPDPSIALPALLRAAQNPTQLGHLEALETIDKLVQGMTDPTPVIQELFTIIGCWKEQQVGGSLIALKDQQDSSYSIIRSTLLRIFIHLETIPPASQSLLLNMLQVEDPDITELTVHILKVVADKMELEDPLEWITPLEQQINAPDIHTQKLALIVYGNLGSRLSEQDVTPLFRHLLRRVEQKNLSILRWEFYALGLLGSALGANDQATLLVFLSKILRGESDLLEDLNEEYHMLMRAWAGEALGFFGAGLDNPAPVIEVLAPAAATDPQPTVKMTAQKALDQIRSAPKKLKASS